MEKEEILKKATPRPWSDDSAKDSGSGDRYQIAHGQIPDGINCDFGYPVCDTMNRHHCISPDEDEANGRLIVLAVNAYEADQALIRQLVEALERLELLVHDGTELCVARTDREKFTDANKILIAEVFTGADAALKAARERTP